MSKEQQLETYLSDGAWRTYKQIYQDTGITHSEVRALPLYTEGALLGDPSRGIKLTRLASPEERRYAFNHMRSRANKIMLRAYAIHAYAAQGAN